MTNFIIQLFTDSKDRYEERVIPPVEQCETWEEVADRLTIENGEAQSVAQCEARRDGEVKTIKMYIEIEGEELKKVRHWWRGECGTILADWRYFGDYMKEESQ